MLRGLGLPLPELLHCGTSGATDYMLLERLPGRDLGLVYPGLSRREKRAIAAEVARIQAIVATLGEGRGFGFVADPRAPIPHQSWTGVLVALVERARVRLDKARPIDPQRTSEVARAVERHAAYIAAVRPTPFLDDTTTKNVLIESGALSGIVDVDWICYGDPLLPVALTWAALAGEGLATDYVDDWCEVLELSTEQRTALALYRALFCLDLLSEAGHPFNRNEAIALDPARVERLSAALEDSLSETTRSGAGR